MTFPSTDEAESFMATWDNGRPNGAELIPVTTSEYGYATMQECVHAGLEGWLDELTTTANSLPC